MKPLIILLYLLSSLVLNNAVYEWSFQQRIKVPSAGATFGITPSALFGRGFLTLITGYNAASPGIFVHTTDDGNILDNQYVWSQQAKLVPSGVSSGDQFGKWMVASNHTLIVSAPAQSTNRGFAYIFNGTLRHWSQIQRLAAFEGAAGDYFGDHMALYENTLMVGARGSLLNRGACYIFGREPGGYTWSRQGKLLAGELETVDTTNIDGYFGEQMSLMSDTVAVSSRSDDLRGSQSGSVYLFKRSGAQWSQQQKLIAVEIMQYNQGINLENLDLTLGNRFFGRSVVINTQYEVAVGVSSLDHGKKNRESVYVFSQRGTNRWSLQQKLFYGNDSTTEQTAGPDLYSDGANTLVASITSVNISSAYIFKIFGNASFGTGWSLQSQLLPYNITEDGLYYNNNSSDPRPAITNFTNPTINGGSLLFTAENEIQIRTQFQNTSCLQIWMSDHFKDGWDTAVLTVIAPDQSNDTFAPHCDQPFPFFVRYCPYSPTDEGVYIIKVFAASKARFFWEISWRVLLESTGQWYTGDFATKMKFNFNGTDLAFSLFETENLVDLTAPCYRCTKVALQEWKELQVIGNFALWPLSVYGAPWYISDYQARVVYSTGKACHGVSGYECYQTIQDGIYILRLGAGLFGELNGFPFNNANWTGCGASGGHRDQLVFRIANGQCEALQVFQYSSRCSRPSPINLVQYSSTPAPTSGGTVTPSQSTFGEAYVKGQMYAVGQDGEHEGHQRRREKLFVTDDDEEEEKKQKDSGKVYHEHMIHVP